MQQKHKTLFLMLVKTIREGNLNIYIYGISATNGPHDASYASKNYGRRLPVFVQSLRVLPSLHPYVYKQFQSRYCTIKKTMTGF